MYGFKNHNDTDRGYPTSPEELPTVKKEIQSMFKVKVIHGLVFFLFKGGGGSPYFWNLLLLFIDVTYRKWLLSEGLYVRKQPEVEIR